MTTEPTEPAGPTGPTEPAGLTGPTEPAGPTGPAGPAEPAAASGGGGARAWLRERSELGVSLLLFALGVLVLTDALTMDVDIAQRGPIGPRTVPFVVGAGLLLVGALLAVDVLRGGRGEAEGGEDVDLDEPADWRTVLLLTGVFLGAAVLIGPLGFPIAGALLFWGAAYALGSRHHDRDPLIAAGLSLFTYFVFDNLLGVPLPGGPLMGVL
ncbi:tripartite tricarboxylate transporter TctB family protein [Streptomyces sp. MBT55]|uniref:tripartite tricarboxylate transporter TctB family protein n=1 Tax=Streptomyces sp. MBT55 TaxID=1488386 RepID=UPI0019127D8D|nr:tripartite tricarboxylate transporter TctB family protein [Streptomyces sp. MBT55]MBK6043203.1 tripartite tricarboxylate transporter TctB family protein [Streptomyces sp. MBT55]